MRQHVPFAASLIAVAVLFAASAHAQSDAPELQPGPAATPQPATPPSALTFLDTYEQYAGLTVRTLTKIADVPADGGGNLAIYVAKVDLHPDQNSASPPEKVPTSTIRGLALVVTAPNRPAVRAYVDESAIDPMIDGLDALSKLGRADAPQTEIHGTYRVANVAVYRLDESEGGTAAVRLVQVSQLTGVPTVGVARYPAARLAEVVRQLRVAKASMNKGTGTK